MNSTAGTLPDLLPGRPRNSFAYMEHTMPITLSWGIDWPTSAISGGFQPLSAPGKIRQILVPPPCSASLSFALFPAAWRTQRHHSEPSDFHAISCDRSVLRPCRNGHTLVTVLRCELGTRIEPQQLRLPKIPNVWFAFCI